MDFIVGNRVLHFVINNRAVTWVIASSSIAFEIHFCKKPDIRSAVRCCSVCRKGIYIERNLTIYSAALTNLNSCCNCLEKKTFLKRLVTPLRFFLLIAPFRFSLLHKRKRTPAVSAASHPQAPFNGRLSNHWTCLEISGPFRAVQTVEAHTKVFCVCIFCSTFLFPTQLCVTVYNVGYEIVSNVNFAPTGVLGEHEWRHMRT